MSRDHALDATRTSAIWFMIVCHVSRLISSNGYRFPNTEQTFSKLRPLFNQGDINSSKSLSLKEFSSLFPSLSKEELSSTFASFDTTQNKLLTFKEFLDGAEKVQLRPSYMELSLDVEPLCQSLFMTMVGVSLLYSLQITKKPDLWRGKQLRRAGELYCIGFVFLFRWDVFRFASTTECAHLFKVSTTSSGESQSSSSSSRPAKEFT